MLYAADLHLHSRYSSAVSRFMTVETIANTARRKGIDLISTGDCLQPQWLGELEQRLVPADAGWFTMESRQEAELLSTLPQSLRNPLRWVLGTEVSCAPVGTPRLGGIHHLLYFPSFESVRRFQKKMERHGTLSEGRPELRLNSRQLLELVLEHGENCQMAPAHVMNPYFSSLGSNEKHETLDELFGELQSQLLAVETGLTSISSMCRRISSLNSHTLFSNSDAHSPEKIGRECTLLEIEAGYDSLMAALRAGKRGNILSTQKVPLYRTRYYLNRCAPCAESFEGKVCPKCAKRLITGSRAYLEEIADLAEPGNARQDPPYRQLLSLKELLADLFESSVENKEVLRYYNRLLAAFGHERHILNEAPPGEMAEQTTPQIAKAILGQRDADTSYFKPRTKKETSADSQMSLF